jgi:iron complex outermembrane receptor protein
LRYRNKTLAKGDIQLSYKGFALGWSVRYTSPQQNIDRRFEEPAIYDLLTPNTTLYNNPTFYLLPGLKDYRAAHNKGIWVNDIRLAYQCSKNLKLSFLINNFFNVEFMSRPGLIEPPRTFVFQAAFKF